MGYFRIRKGSARPRSRLRRVKANKGEVIRLYSHLNSAYGKKVLILENDGRKAMGIVSILDLRGMAWYDKSYLFDTRKLEVVTSTLTKYKKVSNLFNHIINN